MIFEPQKYYFIFQDAVHSLGVGFLIGFVNRLLSAFAGRNKAVVFVKDVVVSVVFAVRIYSYSISFTNYHVMRWYNVAVALAGMALFSPCVYQAASVLVDIGKATARYIFRGAVCTVVEYAGRKRKKMAEKRQKFTQKNKPELLKEDDILLYN